MDNQEEGIAQPEEERNAKRPKIDPPETSKGEEAEEGQTKPPKIEHPNASKGEEDGTEAPDASKSEEKPKAKRAKIAQSDNGGSLDLWEELKARAIREKEEERLEAERQEKVKQEQEERRRAAQAEAEARQKAKQDEEDAKRKRIQDLEDAKWQAELERRERHRRDLIERRKTGKPYIPKAEDDGEEEKIETEPRSEKKVEEKEKTVEELLEEERRALLEPASAPSEKESTAPPEREVPETSAARAAEWNTDLDAAATEGSTEDVPKESKPKAEESSSGKIVLYFSVACQSKIVGRAGGTVNKVRQMSGAEVKVTKNPKYCQVTLSGKPSLVEAAQEMVIKFAGEQPDPSLAAEEGE